MRTRKQIIKEQISLFLYESEFYSAAAIRHKKTGQIVTGTWHGDAIDKAFQMQRNNRKDRKEWSDLVFDDWEHGFVRSDVSPEHPDWFESKQQADKRFGEDESVRLGKIKQLKNAPTIKDIDKW